MGLFACNDNKKSDSKKETTIQLKGDEFVLDSLTKLLKQSPNDVSLLTQRSKTFFRMNRFTKGLSDVSKAYRMDSSSITMRLVHADYMLLNNKILVARNDFNFIIDKQPANTDAYLGMAKSYLIVGDFNNAFEYINIALKKDKYLLDAYLMKGLIYKSKKNWSLAISSYQTAVQIDPNCYEGFVALGSIYEAQEDTLALQFYEAALNINPNGADALYGKALYLQYHDSIQAAQQIYRKITSADTSKYRAFYNQGWIKLVLQEDNDSAAYFFLKTLEIAPKYIDAWYNLGLTYKHRNSNAQARMCFQNAIKIDPKYSLAIKELESLPL